MESTNVLADAYQGIQKYLISIECSDDISKRYLSAYRSLEGYYLSEGAATYTSDINRQYRENVNLQVKSGSLSGRQGSFRRRFAFMVDDYYAEKPIQERYSSGTRYKYTLDEISENLADSFKDSLTISKNSIPLACSVAREFFYYLQEHKLYQSCEVTVEAIVGFINYAAGSHKSSMNNVLCYLRKVLLFLKNNGFQVPDAGTVSYRTAPARRRIYPAFDDGDLALILNAPDRSTPMGKRDYAVLLLASFTGLRAIDVANLTFDNINRTENSITFVQHKTNHGNALPINTDVLAAIDDYTQNARPDCLEPYVFLTVTRPYRKLNDMSSVRNVLDRYIRLCGIEKSPWDGKAFHAFRRTVGKWLLESSADAQMISQVLGHRDKDVLKRYLPLSLSILGECALDFTYAPLKTEVYQ